jgi:hypothetical protein
MKRKFLILIVEHRNGDFKFLFLLLRLIIINMTEETKKQLMQSVYKLADHYQIPNATLVSFKKRNLLLELINTKNSTAFKFINDLIESTVQLDRIENDKEKQTKKPEHWNAETITAKNLVNKSTEKLMKFLEAEGIKNEELKG